MDGIVIVVNPLICAGVFVITFIVWRFQLIPRAIDQIRKGGRL